MAVVFFVGFVLCFIEIIKKGKPSLALVYYNVIVVMK